MRSRAFHLLKWAVVLGLAGAGYGLFVRITGVGIPCPFHALTGWYCPGCGISRLCLALLRLDFAAALQSNAAVFALLPVGAAVLCAWAVQYIRTGEQGLRRWQTVLVGGMIVVLLLFGLLRNLPAFSFLAPLVEE